MKKSVLIIIIVIAPILIILGVWCFAMIAPKIESPILCIKSRNCCKSDRDCKYFLYTGDCYTPEYVKKVINRSERLGIFLGEAPEFSGKVECTCENKKCVAKDEHGCLIRAGVSTWFEATGRCVNAY
ncbi:MAG: hypothetical protein PHS27_01905 [Candidatus Pacebacteria bacterium]|nr:hypothetical protein [Candidatus Paceibacterota bacterium]